MNSQRSKLLVNSLAMVVIVGILALIATSLTISTRSRGVFGPTFLATDADDRVYVNIGAVLYRLDREGRLEQRIPLDVLGINHEPVTDALVMPDGALLLGSSGTRRIVSCTLEKPACTAFLKSGPQPASAFKMVWDDTRNRLLVVDGEGHRILGYDRAGAFTGEYAGGEGGLRFPNTAVLTAADELVVADTNHHRLVALDAETLSSEQWGLAVRNELGNFRRIWPTDVVMTATNRFWVILDDDLLEHGDIILFDSAGTARQRLDLPADWDPVKLRARRDDVLVAEFGSVDLLSVSPDGKMIRPFGDSAFRAALADMRASRSSNDRWWRLWIWIALVPLLTLAIVTAWLDHRRRAREPAVSAAADQPAILTAAADGIGGRHLLAGA